MSIVEKMANDAAGPAWERFRNDPDVIRDWVTEEREHLARAALEAAEKAADDDLPSAEDVRGILPKAPPMSDIPEKFMTAARAVFTDVYCAMKEGKGQTATIARALMAAAKEADEAATKRAGWQPIETAPKDGTPIIGGFQRIRWADSHRRGDIVKCWYQPEFEAFISSCREMQMAPGYTINGKTRALHSPVIEQITEWMPLPVPPTIKGEA